ncbi:DUF6801 domain-containing protein [Actinomadura sp. 7K507]|uniref:DUF6801 domain-containing protein n=1 Tax=Actinomadura sp. 7K507 TaxID=2530365 RepID=UPI00104F22CD|nr:DUF6801 domain-containing protein [Actinomadura sp. 7K507]TDC90472.1 hypothetical protein E1285_14750 [Actinomadura sp. 7K507]
MSSRHAGTAGPGGRLRRRLTAVAGAAVVALSLLAPSAAHALPPDDVPEIGVDTGRFKLPIGCTISLAGLPVFYLPTDVDVQGVAPVQIGPGQEFWLTQGSGSITFPTWLTSLAPILGLTTADAKVTDLTIGASDSTPSAINIAEGDPFEIDDIAITPGEPLKVGLPLTGTFDVGPFTAPDSGKVTLAFDHAVAEINLNSSAGFSLPIKADCKPSAGNALLTIGVGGEPGQPPAKITGAPLNFPEPASNELVGIINAPYACTVGGEPLNVGIAVGAHIPLVVRRGGSFSFSEASGALVIPAETVNRLMDKGYGSASGTVTALNLRVEGGTPATQNVIPSGGVAIPETTLVRDQKITVPLPSDGTLTAGPFRPSSGAETVSVSLGSAAADLSFDGAPGTTPATCDAPSPTVYLVDNTVT